MINRILAGKIKTRLFSGKAIILVGARQVGKTTMLETLFHNDPNVLWLNGDDLDVRTMFENMTSTRLQAIIGHKKLMIIDEAQRIPDIGMKLKLITDQIKDVQLIATGSSSFELANRVNEPLTGRKWEYNMFPVSFAEMVAHHGLLEEKRMIPHRLVFGYYPEIVCNPGNEKTVLKQLSDSFLYRDILNSEKIQKTDGLIKLLQALAFQVGTQVSYNELGQLCRLDYKTIEKYITILEQAYIIFRLGSFSRNLRNELKFSKKVYFFDNGIRNAIIANFSQIENRADVGALWENLLVSERIKYLHYSGKWCNFWYWRTTNQKEIDYIEEADGQMNAYEFKWNPGKKIKAPALFLNNYPESRFYVIHRENFDAFLL